MTNLEEAYILVSQTGKQDVATVELNHPAKKNGLWEPSTPCFAKFSKQHLSDNHLAQPVENISNKY